MNNNTKSHLALVWVSLTTLAFGLCLFPGIGSASVYDKLKQEKANYTLPTYPSDYGTEKKQGPKQLENADQLRPAIVMENRFTKIFYPDETRVLSTYDGDASKAASLLSGNWQLKDLEAMVLLRNAGIQSAALKVRSARDGYSQVRELNDILTQYSAFTEGLNPGVGPRKGSPMPNSQFPFPGTLQLKNRVVTTDIRIAQNNLEKEKRENITQLRTTFWNYVYNQRAINITEEIIDLLDHLKQVAGTKYRAGRTSYYDLVRIDIRVELLKKDLVTLTWERERLTLDLLDLLNLPSDTPVVSPGKAAVDSRLPSFEVIADLALERHQELDLIQSRIDRMTLMLRTAENMTLPGYSLNFSDFKDQIVSQAGPDAKPGFKTKTMASKGYGAPVKPFSGYLNSWLDQTRKEIKAMEKKLVQERYRVISRVKKAWVSLDQAIREKQLYETSILDLSKSSLDVALREYETGRLSFPSISEAYTEWLNTNLMLARKETSIGIYNAKIDQIAGLNNAIAFLAQINIKNETKK